MSWGLLPAAMLSASAPLMFALRGTSVIQTVAAYGLLLAALVVAWFFDRNRRTDGLFRDLLLIAVGMLIVSTV